MLKTSVLAALLLCASIRANYAQDTPKAPEGWVLAWSDEFDGPNIDKDKWTFEIGNNNGWGNNELEYYTDDPTNAFIQDGKLVIQAKKEQKEGYKYTSARMKTQGKFNTIYGRIEARFKLPAGGPGIWPAFWMLGENIDKVGWPACGDINIMEWVGTDPKNVYGLTHGVGFDTKKSFPLDSGSTDFHRYAVDWEPNSVKFSVDDEVYDTVTPADTNGAPFLFNDNPMFILLNLAVGGNWPGNPDDSTQFPQQYIIDWVRVYKKTEDVTKPTKRKCLRRK